MTPTAAEAKEAPPEVRRIVFDSETIGFRVQALAKNINRDYRGRRLILVGVLKGAALFTSDLVRYINLPLRLDFLAVNSYSPASRSRQVTLLKDLSEDISGSDVLLVEDIVDTGLTLHHLLRHLKKRRPASLRVCTLLNRPTLRLVELPLAYQGFEVSQDFLIGYGLDFRENFRDLPYIATMKQRKTG